MSILFLDDDPRRHTAFQLWLEAGSTGRKGLGDWAKTIFKCPLRKAASLKTQCVFAVEPAIEALQNSPQMDIAFLDHDLGGKVYVQERDGTGTEVAEHIATMNPGRRPRLVVVHSFNPHGADRMIGILADCGCEARQYPFGSDDFIACLPIRRR